MADYSQRFMVTLGFYLCVWYGTLPRTEGARHAVPLLSICVHHSH